MSLNRFFGMQSRLRLSDLSFEVITGHLWSFGAHLVAPNSNMIGVIVSASKKTYKKDILKIKGDLVNLINVFTMGHLESFGGHLAT